MVMGCYYGEDDAEWGPKAVDEEHRVLKPLEPALNLGLAVGDSTRQACTPSPQGAFDTRPILAGHDLKRRRVGWPDGFDRAVYAPVAHRVTFDEWPNLLTRNAHAERGVGSDEIHLVFTGYGARADFYPRPEAYSPCGLKP